MTNAREVGGGVAHIKESWTVHDLCEYFITSINSGEQRELSIGDTLVCIEPGTIYIRIADPDTTSFSVLAKALEGALNDERNTIVCPFVVVIETSISDPIILTAHGAIKQDSGINEEALLVQQVSLFMANAGLLHVDKSDNERVELIFGTPEFFEARQVLEQTYRDVVARLQPRGVGFSLELDHEGSFQIRLQGGAYADCIIQLPVDPKGYIVEAIHIDMSGLEKVHQSIVGSLIQVLSGCTTADVWRFILERRDTAAVDCISASSAVTPDRAPIPLARESMPAIGHETTMQIRTLAETCGLEFQIGVSSGTEGDDQAYTYYVMLCIYDGDKIVGCLNWSTYRLQTCRAKQNPVFRSFAMCSKISPFLGGMSALLECHIDVTDYDMGLPKPGCINDYLQHWRTAVSGLKGLLSIPISSLVLLTDDEETAQEFCRMLRPVAGFVDFYMYDSLGQELNQMYRTQAKAIRRHDRFRDTILDLERVVADINKCLEEILTVVDQVDSTNSTISAGVHDWNVIHLLIAVHLVERPDGSIGNKIDPVIRAFYDLLSSKIAKGKLQQIITLCQQFETGILTLVESAQE